MSNKKKYPTTLPAKKAYWNWQRAFTIFASFVVLFGFLLYTVSLILFR